MYLLEWCFIDHWRTLWTTLYFSLSCIECFASPALLPCHSLSCQSGRGSRLRSNIKHCHSLVLFLTEALPHCTTQHCAPPPPIHYLPFSPYISLKRFLSISLSPTAGAILKVKCQELNGSPVDLLEVCLRYFIESC